MSIKEKTIISFEYVDFGAIYLIFLWKLDNPYYHSPTLILQDCKLHCDISSLLDILNSLGDKKDVKIRNHIHFFLDNDWSEQVTMETFKQAEKIIENKFPKDFLFLVESKYFLLSRKYCCFTIQKNH